MRSPRSTSSTRYVVRHPNHDVLRSIYDERLAVLTAHETRSHMASDLRRYLYAATFAQETGRSPKLSDFPTNLLPDHQNVEEGRNGKMFSDRFRVQLADHVSTTVTSHISKDGHYFIHYDPTQCRSLTVREAARLQTFPDNYFFAGPRTEQYHQVGNAVPPKLAQQIAAIVAEVLDSIRGSR
jgi:DNA (cytosine-5)-methyltransferase 1